MTALIALTAAVVGTVGGIVLGWRIRDGRPARVMRVTATTKAGIIVEQERT